MSSRRILTAMCAPKSAALNCQVIKAKQPLICGKRCGIYFKESGRITVSLVPPGAGLDRGILGSSPRRPGAPGVLGSSPRRPGPGRIFLPGNSFLFLTCFVPAREKSICWTHKHTMAHKTVVFLPHVPRETPQNRHDTSCKSRSCSTAQLLAYDHVL